MTAIRRRRVVYENDIRDRLKAVAEVAMSGHEAIERREILRSSIPPVRTLLGGVCPLVMWRHQSVAEGVRLGDPGLDQPGLVLLAYPRPVPPRGSRRQRSANRIRDPIRIVRRIRWLAGGGVQVD